MPNYNFPTYSSYQAYPVANQTVQPNYYQQPTVSYQQVQQPRLGIEWVDGEVGAKAYQLPAGWPANAPIPLWDTNDTVIYLKSINQMGMPNPIQRIRYTMEEMSRTAPILSSTSALPSGAEQHAQSSPDMSQYVRKEDLERVANDLKNAINASKNNGGEKNGKSAV